MNKKENNEGYTKKSPDVDLMSTSLLTFGGLGVISTIGLLGSGTSGDITIPVAILTATFLISSFLMRIYNLLVDNISKEKSEI